MTSTSHARIICNRCRRTMDRSRLLLLAADALQAAASMESLINNLMDSFPPGTKLMAVESLAGWRKANEAINHTLKADIRTGELIDQAIGKRASA